MVTTVPQNACVNETQHVLQLTAPVNAPSQGGQGFCVTSLAQRGIMVSTVLRRASVITERLVILLLVSNLLWLSLCWYFSSVSE